MTKDEIIELIDNRIKSEYRKHKDLDWSKIAAQKIHGSLVKLFAIPDVVGQSEQFTCPCCGSNNTYKTEAYHCNRCAETTEV